MSSTDQGLRIFFPSPVVGDLEELGQPPPCSTEPCRSRLRNVGGSVGGGGHVSHVLVSYPVSTTLPLETEFG